MTETVKRDGMRMPIDFFFRSLAEDQHEKAVCVILSGSGSDGTHGLREVRGAGGMTIVQAPETAQFDAMVRNAIATGMVDYVLPVCECGFRVARRARKLILLPCYSGKSLEPLSKMVLSNFSRPTSTVKR